MNCPEEEAGRFAGPQARPGLRRYAPWLAILILPIPVADFAERLCIDPMIRRAWDTRTALFPAIEKLLSLIGLSNRSPDLTTALWNESCAAAQALPYVLLVVAARLVWLHSQGGGELRPTTALRTLGVLGIVAATRLPSLLTGWAILSALDALFQSDEALAAKLLVAFNEWLPCLSYALNKVPAALIALLAVHTITASSASPARRTSYLPSPH